MFPVPHRLDVQSSYPQHRPNYEPVDETQTRELSIADTFLPDDTASLPINMAQLSCKQEAPRCAIAHLVPLEEQVRDSLDRLSACLPAAALQGMRFLADKMWEQKNVRIDMILADEFIKVAGRLPATFVVEDAASLQRLAPSDVRSFKLYALWGAWHLGERAQANLALQLKRELDGLGRADLAAYRPLVRQVAQATCEARLHIALWTRDMVAVQCGQTPLAEPDTKLPLWLSGVAYNLKVERTGGSPAAVWQQWEEDVHKQISDHQSLIRGRGIQVDPDFA